MSEIKHYQLITYQNSFLIMRTIRCVDLAPIVPEAAVGCAALVAGTVVPGVVEAAVIVVVVVVMTHVVADVMAHVVALVGKMVVQATALLLAEWTALVDVAVVLLHVEAAPEFAEMVVDITAAVIAVVVLKILTIQAPALKLINLED